MVKKHSLNLSMEYDMDLSLMCPSLRVCTLRTCARNSPITSERSSGEEKNPYRYSVATSITRPRQLEDKVIVRSHLTRDVIFLRFATNRHDSLSQDRRK